MPSHWRGGLSIGTFGLAEFVVIICDVPFGILHTENGELLERAFDDVHKAVVTVGVGRFQIEAIVNQKLDRISHNPLNQL